MSRKRAKPEPVQETPLVKSKVYHWSSMWLHHAHPCPRYSIFFYDRQFLRLELQDDGSYAIVLDQQKHNEFRIAGTPESISLFLGNNTTLDPSRITLDSATLVLHVQGDAGTSLSIRCTRKNVRWINDRYNYST